MNKEGPIIIIEDDVDDRNFLSAVFTDLNYGNEIVFFEDGVSALEYLRDDKIYPFLILSDINLPKLSGLELKKMVQTNDSLSVKCIPYLFFSTHVDKNTVYNAYTMSAQGFFVKPDSFDKLKHTVNIMIMYWRECYSPNYFEDK